jgi:hypothetical protein
MEAALVAVEKHKSLPAGHRLLPQDFKIGTDKLAVA